MITEILKSKTAFQHKTLEEKMHSHKIMSGNFSLADYFRMIEMNYRFISNFEKEIFDLIPLDLAQKLNLNKRSKLSHIQKDAAQIGLAISFSFFYLLFVGHYAKLILFKPSFGNAFISSDPIHDFCFN